MGALKDAFLGDTPYQGSTYHAPRDQRRLSSQMLRVQSLMSDGAWRTLAAIRNSTGGTEASLSARLRDLRKRGRVVERRHLHNGLWEYRLTPTI